MSESPAPVIQLKDVSFAYGASNVLSQVSFGIKAGEFVSIVGPNGGGKSTLLKLLLGLLKPQQGQVRIFDQTPEKARPRIGYMPQHVDHDKRFPATVLEVVLMGRLGRSRGWGPFARGDRQQAMAALEEVGLADQAKRSLSDLSGGQRQRALIARALASQPELLMLDEPTSNIDVKAVDDFYELLSKLHQRMTIVIVSHDMGFVSSKVQSVLCVNHQVHFHPTSDIMGQCIRDIYGSDVRLVRHDHRCSEQGHQCQDS
ncbi:MAG: ABC transporter ATP-binding protein [Deltaproteobacteria bacterium]|nr:ABC transporter ATP-binding protein [Deltaproteobacteria bacterium]